MVDPGSIFSILTNIIEISKKSEEHNDELKELHQNSEILLSLLKDLESTNVLPDSVKEDVVKDLAEAQKFLESPEIKNWSQKILIGVMGFLPGNKTSQLKEKNEKIYRHINRIKAFVDVKMTKNNLTMNSKFNSNPDPKANKNDEPLPEHHTYKRTKTESLKNIDVFEPTINQNALCEPTLVQANNTGELAYEIIWEGDKDIFEQYLSGNKDFCVIETLKFREVREQLIKDSNLTFQDIYSVGRGKFFSLIKEKSKNVNSFLSLISGNHLKLVVQKIEILVDESQVDKDEKDEQDEKEKNEKEKDEKEKDEKEKPENKKDENKLAKPTLFFTCEDGNDKTLKKYQYDFLFYVEDMSTNGSYILTKDNFGEKDGWKRLPPKTRQLIEDGDRIGIVMDGKTHQNLLLGFLFRKIEY